MNYTAKKNIPVDIIVKGNCLTSNKFGAGLEGKFESESGEILVIPGFYSGDSTWTVRFSSEKEEMWRYEINSDTVILNGETKGTITINGDVNAPLSLKTKGTHFITSDGKPFFYIGFECNFLPVLVASENGDKKLKTLVENLKQGAFNVIEINAYGYDSSFYKGKTCDNDYGPAESRAWLETDGGSELNLDYFRHYDEMMSYLLENGIYAHIYLKVYNKLEKLPERYSEEESIYLRYMLARYQAYPNLIWNYSKEGYFEADKDYFYHNAKKIRCMDAYRHLCTIHDDLVYALDPEYGKTVDFLVLQQFGEYASSCMYYRERSKKPVVLGEFAQDYSWHVGTNKLSETQTHIFETKHNFASHDESQEDMTTPEEIVTWSYEAVMAGAGFQYYNIFLCWDVIQWDYLPFTYHYYKQMKEFFSQFNMLDFEPSPESSMWQIPCLDDHKGTLLILIEPEKSFNSEPAMKGIRRASGYNRGEAWVTRNKSKEFLSYKAFGIFSGKIYDFKPIDMLKGRTDISSEDALYHYKDIDLLRAPDEEPIIVILKYQNK